MFLTPAPGGNGSSSSLSRAICHPLLPLGLPSLDHGLPPPHDHAALRSKIRRFESRTERSTYDSFSSYGRLTTIRPYRGQTGLLLAWSLAIGHQVARPEGYRRPACATRIVKPPRDTVVTVTLASSQRVFKLFRSSGQEGSIVTIVIPRFRRRGIRICLSVHRQSSPSSYLTSGAKVVILPLSV
jgi:hypothetical protein